ncbi:glycosyltransferase [Leptospira sp. 201903071]|uniref:glycosyltransferase family 2 protein n=1 Tax=Leptospira ainazelensis TaxID=2810034 RepID=UPI001963710C|nr:glycosyltransferase family 2 protein [Leptospira ainazelensis]MBM9501988.1 glycosyltransferase [Leptospira ainazelensis]
MKKPKISIITINYNDREGLEKTILSVRNQNFDSYEHVVIDAGSKDGSVDVIKKYEDKISHWVSEKDKGIYDGQNKGIKAAKGEYCLFLNSGDFLVDSNVLYDVFSKEYEEDFLYGDMLIDSGNGKIVYGRSPRDLDLHFLAYGVLWHCVTFIRRSLFKEYGIYDTSYKIAADVDFFLKAIGVGGASWRYLSRPISQFNTFGFGSNPKNENLLEEERARMRSEHLSQATVNLLAEYHRMEKDYIIFSYFFLPQILNFFRNFSFLRAFNRKLFQFLNR